MLKNVGKTRVGTSSLWLVLALLLSACQPIMPVSVQPPAGLPPDAPTSAVDSAFPQVEVVRAFGESLNHLPEGVFMDREGNLYVSLGPPFFVGGGYGAVRQISADGTEHTLFEFPSGPAPAGLAVDAGGDVFFALPNPGQPDVGVYRLTGDGSAERLPGTEGMVVPNGLAFDGQGTLYASDSILGSIWRMQRDGANAEPWFSHDWLMGCGEEDAIGANGITYGDEVLYVASTAKGLIVRIPILSDGSPGAPELVAGKPDCNLDDELYGMDGIALDGDGTIYALLVLSHRLVRIDPTDSTITTLLDEEDGLWNPASIIIDTQENDNISLFMTNYAVIPPEPANSLGAALLKYEVGR